MWLYHNWHSLQFLRNERKSSTKNKYEHIWGSLCCSVTLSVGTLVPVSATSPHTLQVLGSYRSLPLAMSLGTIYKGWHMHPMRWITYGFIFLSRGDRKYLLFCLWAERMNEKWWKMKDDDFKLTDEWTFVNVELLLWLKRATVVAGYYYFRLFFLGHLKPKIFLWYN